MTKRPGARERLDEQLVGRAVAAAGELLGAQREPQPPQREPVEPAERAEQQLGRELGGRAAARPIADVDEREQGARRRVVAQRDAAA